MNQKASGKIATTFENFIQDGTWKPGDKLPALSQLARNYSVSVSTIREALRILETRGYVLIEHGRGVFVRNKTQWKEDAYKEITLLPGGDLASLLEFRLVLEPEMASLAAQRATPGQINLIKQAAIRMMENVSKGEDFFEADIGFHHNIAEASANPVMEKVMKSISDMLAESRRITSRLPGTVEKASYFHMLIAIAIEQRNSSQAYELMKSHLNDVTQEFMKIKRNVESQRLLDRP